MNPTTVYIVALLLPVVALVSRRWLVGCYRRAVAYRGVYEPEDVDTASGLLCQTMHRVCRWKLWWAVIGIILAGWS